MAKGKTIKIYESARHAKIRKAAAAGKIKLVPEKLKITGRGK